MSRKGQRASSTPSSPCILAAAAIVPPGVGRQNASHNWQIRYIPMLVDSCSCWVAQKKPSSTSKLRAMQSAMPVRSLAGRGSIKVTAAILEQVDLFVGNDSALVHLAVAGGTPTVAIFGLTNSRAWGPFSGGVPRATSHSGSTKSPLHALFLSRPRPWNARRMSHP